MKVNLNTKITIIGFGNLMQDIFSCVENFVGKENLMCCVNATTAEMSVVAENAVRFGIEIFYLDNLSALKILEPDLIFFAPPPSLAPAIIGNELLTYFEWLRREQKPLPEIYAYPPLPKGDYYRKVLGDDVKVANIIPNDIRVIAGKPVAAERSITSTLTVFSGPWQEADLERFHSVFSPLGGVLDLKSEELIPVLGGRVISNTMAIVCLELEKWLQEAGYKITYRQAAGFMRAVLQEKTAYSPRTISFPCSRDEVQGEAAFLLEALILAWSDGLALYFSDSGFSKPWVKENPWPGLDLTLHKTQCEDPGPIHEHIVIAATKGGVLEKGLMVVREQIYPDLKKAILELPLLPDTNWQANLTEKVRQGAHVVREHGGRLSG